LPLASYVQQGDEIAEYGSVYDYSHTKKNKQTVVERARDLNREAFKLDLGMYASASSASSAEECPWEVGSSVA
jgi:hypothetical protein